MLALLVAGCSGDSNDSSAEHGDSAADDASEAPGSADDGVASEIILTDRDASLAVFTQFFLFPPEYHQTLKECMKAQGFEYLEPPPPEFIIPLNEMTSLLEEVAALDPTSSRYRNRYGYGVSTIGAYLTTVSLPDEDPNRELLQTMSDSERQAWWDALQGPIETVALGSDVFESVEIGGCTKEAEDAAGIDWNLLEEDSVANQERRQRIEASEGYVEMEQGWARCAAEQGLDNLASFGDQYRLLYDKLAEIRAPNPFESLTDEEHANLSDEELDELYELQDQLYSLEDLAAVQQEELDLAQQLADCDRAYWSGFAELEDQLDPDG